MCGIVGAVAERNIVPILVEGLRRLEYRGYDSAGVAVIDAEGASPLYRLAARARSARMHRLLDAVDPALVEGADSRRQFAYVDLGLLERALVETKAEAAWPGWGFVAETPEFVELCDRLGVTFIGPSAGAMRGLADKIASKRLAQGLGVPVVPWAGAAATSSACASSASLVPL